MWATLSVVGVVAVAARQYDAAVAACCVTSRNDSLLLLAWRVGGVETVCVQ